jgi:serine O-acetyltransferase
MDDKRLENLASEFKMALDAQLSGDYGCEFGLPSREAAAQICRHYLGLLFPVFYQVQGAEVDRATTESRHYLAEIETLLREQLCSAMRFDRRCQGEQSSVGIEDRAQELTELLFDQLPDLAKLLASDIEAAFRNDPAAASPEEILLSYPCMEAITVQRLAHRLYLMGVPFLPRMMTEVAHSHTGIDINPGASIGESFFIDHGTGVVIGETASIGKRVTLYHGVTLGAFNPLRKDEEGQLRRGQENKRHPDLEDHVTVYPNATILGGQTRVGHHSVIGGNVWLTHSVQPYSKVTLKDPELVIFNGLPGDYSADFSI